MKVILSMKTLMNYHAANGRGRNPKNNTIANT